MLSTTTEPDSYPIPASPVLFEEEIKHSRFISLLFHCGSTDELKCALTNAKHDYPGASHYCYAFISDAPGNSLCIGSSDDGEPAGSAGRPMLATLQGSGIGEIAAIVIRYYGGTKLGVGGLVRAYTSGIKQGLSLQETVEKKILFPGSLTCDYPQLQDVEHLLHKYKAEIHQRLFTDKVRLSFSISRLGQAALALDLAAMSQGRLLARFS